MEDNKTVSLITINLDGKELIKELLSSVRELDYPADNIEIIIVDNGSTDGSVDYLERNCPEIMLIKNPRNLGFAYPSNQGARAARGDYLVFVNNDMRLQKSWLKEMLRHIDKDGGVVCVGSKILNADGTKIDFIGGSVSYNGMGSQQNFGKDAALFDEKTPKEILFSCGGAMLIDRKVFLGAGGFDEDYFAFFEDVDLGWRLWVMGYRVVFAPAAVAYHRHHQTAKRFSRHKLTTLYERNSLYTVYKNYDEENLNKAFPVTFIMSAMRLLDSAKIDVSQYSLNGPKNIGKKKNPVKTAYRKVMSVALERLASLLLDFRLKSRVCVRDSTIHCFSPAVAVAQFGLNLKQMKEKREAVQKNRRRSDSEIFEKFKDSFGMEIKDSRHNQLGVMLKDLWK